MPTFFFQIHSPRSSVSCLTWKTKMRSRKATLALLTKISVLKLLWEVNTTRKKKKKPKLSSAILANRAQPWSASSVIPCHREQGTVSAAYEVDHIVIGIIFSKKRHPNLCFQKINPNPKSGHKFIKGRTTVCIWLEASTVHLSEYENRLHSLMESHVVKLGMILCSSDLFAYGSERLYKYKICEA